MPQLDPTWFASQLFWLAITFITLYILMARFVLPPLQEVIARRLQTKEQDVAAAEAMKLEAQAAKADYERALSESRQKAQGLIAEVALASKAKAEQASRDLDAQVAKKLADATQKIAAKKQELIQALSPATGELASLIADRLTQNAKG